MAWFSNGLFIFYHSISGPVLNGKTRPFYMNDKNYIKPSKQVHHLKTGPEIGWFTTIKNTGKNMSSFRMCPVFITVIWQY
jgi:hypothetical protein